ncbi:MAG: tetratricopeptide repeat protein [Pseudomonadota bacterium]|nr:tetratricopeptide repeat protein [Pseudomonadota bacterium]
MWKWIVALLLFGVLGCMGAVGAGGWWWWSNEKARAQAVAVELAEAEQAREAAVEQVAVEADRANRLEEARVAYGAGNHAVAVDAYTDVLEADPAQGEAWLGRGRSYAQLDRLDLAEGDLRRATQLDPTRVEGWESLAWVLARNGRDAEAVTALDRLVALDPVNAKAIRDRANARYRSGDVGGAVFDAKRACSMGLAEGCALEEKIRAATR